MVCSIWIGMISWSTIQIYKFVTSTMTINIQPSNSLVKKTILSFWNSKLNLLENTTFQWIKKTEDFSLKIKTINIQIFTSLFLEKSMMKNSTILEPILEQIKKTGSENNVNPEITMLSSNVLGNQLLMNSVSQSMVLIKQNSKWFLNRKCLPISSKKCLFLMLSKTPLPNQTVSRLKDNLIFSIEHLTTKEGLDISSSKITRLTPLSKQQWSYSDQKTLKFLNPSMVCDPLVKLVLAKLIWFLTKPLNYLILPRWEWWVFLKALKNKTLSEIKFERALLFSQRVT